MKNIIRNCIYIITICILLTGFSQELSAQKHYTLSGTIKGIPDVEIKMVEGEQVDLAKIISTSKIKDSKFEFSGQIDNIKLVSLVFKKAKEDEVSYFVPLVLDEGETTISVDASICFDDPSNSHLLVSPNLVIASQITKDFQTYIKARMDLMYTENGKKQTAFTEDFEKNIKPTGNEPSEDWYVKRSELNSALFADYEVVIKTCVKQLSNSLAGIIICNNAYFDVFSVAEMKMILTNYKKNFEATPQFKILEKKINRILNVEVGAIAPQFTMENDKGGQTSLSEFKGQYLLVDFWTSTCSPCIASFPHLNKLYSKYHDDGFEIIHISTDHEKKYWYEALEKHKNPWPQVIENVEVKKGESITDIYVVKYNPYVYLLDKEGRIIAKNPKDEELDAKLKDIFGH
ncbi:TlpA disulfide reductase family protein [Flavivirga eckloniae]|uniref:Thioredoxin domain-containing protein n=1 Tax=Flavivirga eckloniae TaxID=1803846 RepID=A0A2K9PM58_9FLAO|nr:TlpA disulfide reductase family protein [Flavivirga eckloniae]AUP77928.1 hypothetical protein C1H87_04055 [Flavivirga eckloniae]